MLQIRGRVRRVPVPGFGEQAAAADDLTQGVGGDQLDPPGQALAQLFEPAAHRFRQLRVTGLLQQGRQGLRQRLLPGQDAAQQPDRGGVAAFLEWQHPQLRLWAAADDGQLDRAAGGQGNLGVGDHPGAKQFQHHLIGSGLGQHPGLEALARLQCLQRGKRLGRGAAASQGRNQCLQGPVDLHGQKVSIF